MGDMIKQKFKSLNLIDVNSYKIVTEDRFYTWLRCNKNEYLNTKQTSC